MIKPPLAAPTAKMLLNESYAMTEGLERGPNRSVWKKKVRKSEASRAWTAILIAMVLAYHAHIEVVFRRVTVIALCYSNKLLKRVEEAHGG